MGSEMCIRDRSARTRYDAADPVVQCDVGCAVMWTASYRRQCSSLCASSRTVSVARSQWQHNGNSQRFHIGITSRWSTEITTTDTDRDHTSSDHMGTTTDSVRRRVDVDPLSLHRAPVGNVQCDDTAILKGDIASDASYSGKRRGWMESGWTLRGCTLNCCPFDDRGSEQPPWSGPVE